MKRAETEASKFNQRFSVGDPISLELDDGTREDSHLASAAWVIGGHSVIAKVEGRAGGWLVSRIHPRDLT
jgi:hypothetical protein